ncbi:Calcium calmodulin-dependent protein kinase kinase 2 [Perkinsus olseni]|uniref:Calcium calmodulin-dependent protein kinase kinase 2 n=1 Tax=Perkinsus olseni TaxID=32597 RepID=A0A7J6RJH4_PEROL|nr:Calcium calmodulin-dependent protein kinase kinase 2 [Perkinsus olseni]
MVVSLHIGRGRPFLGVASPSLIAVRLSRDEYPLLPVTTKPAALQKDGYYHWDETLQLKGALVPWVTLAAVTSNPMKVLGRGELEVVGAGDGEHECELPPWGRITVSVKTAFDSSVVGAEVVPRQQLPRRSTVAARAPRPTREHTLPASAADVILESCAAGRVHSQRRPRRTAEVIRVLSGLMDDLRRGETIPIPVEPAPTPTVEASVPKEDSGQLPTLLNVTLLQKHPEDFNRLYIRFEVLDDGGEPVTAATLLKSGQSVAVSLPAEGTYQCRCEFGSSGRHALVSSTAVPLLEVLESDGIVRFSTSCYFVKLKRDADPSLAYPRAFKDTDGGIQSIAGYHLGPVIDRGPCRTIKLCRKDSGQDLVMKVYRNISLSRQKFYHNLPSGGMVRHTALEGLQLEVHVLQRLGVHPSIVALRDVFYNPDRQKTYLVLDCCPGGPVQRWNSIKCKYEPIIADYNLLKSYIVDVLQGLEFIHSRHVVHRDIKPENLLIDAQGRVRISDFGSARIVGEEDSMGLGSTLGCTYPFLAPEMCGIPSDDEEEDDDDDDDEDSSLSLDGVDGVSSPTAEMPYQGDMWAAGITFWTMLVGKLPFYSSDLSKLFNTIARCDLPVEDLQVATRDAPPSWLTQLITSLLRRRPSDRPRASEAIDMVPVVI